MKLETTFLRSKLARRIFWLFVLCALIPISLLAVVSLRDVTAQLKEESLRQLHQASREEAMTISERLGFLEADLKLIGLDAQTGAGAGAAPYQNEIFSHLTRHFNGLELSTPAGEHETLFGKVRRRMVFTDEEKGFLHSGKNVLSTMACGESERCVFLSRELDAGHSEKGILTADMKNSYLWDAGDLPQDMDTCVLDTSGKTLFCSGETPRTFPERVTESFSGTFEWKANGRQYQADYWNLPLKNSFYAPHWTIVSSEAKPDILAPLTQFRTSFLLVFLLTVWIVLLLSMIQIRRQLVPLGKLQEGTARVASGDFDTKVTVESGDEFEELAASFNQMAGRIEKQLRSLKVVNEIDRAILSAWNIDEIVDTLSKRLGDLLPHDLVSVSIFDSDGSSEAVVYLYEPKTSARRQMERIEVTREELRELHKQAGVSVLGNNMILPSYLKPLAERGMRALLIAPILLEGRPSAVFTLGLASSSIWTQENEQHARQLADQVAVALSNSHLVSELQQLHWGTLTALARAIDAKSPWTLGHSERVTDCAVKIAETMGLGSKELDIMRRGGLLHDIGKIGTPAEILEKPGKLTQEELKIMREHVNIGARILQPIPGLAESMSIVLQHHEWVNGSGYPNGLRGEEISLYARIFAVADCFDALTSDRPYRPGLPVDRVVDMIGEGAGKQFDPLVVEAFRRMMKQENGEEKPEEIRERFADAL